MTPKITRQTKILIKDKHGDNSSHNAAKFSAMDPVPTNELTEWEENAAGWEVDAMNDFNDATKVLREQRRRERELRLMEQQQRRLERTTKSQPLGAKLCS